MTGRKRFSLTDTLGWVLGLVIVAAHEGEGSGAEKLFQTTRGKYPRLVKVWADQGFAGEKYLARVKLLFGLVLETVSKV